MPEGTIYNILHGNDNNFTSITADPGTSLTSGKIYMANTDAVHIIKDTTKYDYYSRTQEGRDKEVILSLSVEEINIVDIDVTLGT